MEVRKAIDILNAHRNYYQAVEQQLQAAPLCEALEMAIEAFHSLNDQKEQIESQKKQIERLINLAAQKDSRLQHLLQSDFIKSFDAIHPRYGKNFELGGEYARDIKEADRLGALIDVYAGKGGFEFSISQIKDLIKDRESFLQGDDDSDQIYKNDIIALQTAIIALQTHDEAVKIRNRLEQGEAESLNREVYNRLQDIIKLYPYPLGGKNFEEWDGSGD